MRANTVANGFSAIILAVAVIIDAGTVCVAQVPQRGGTVTAVYSVETHALFSPAGGGGNALFTATKVLERLIRLQHDGTFTPELATAWSLSDDGRTYTFQLRENVRWHDGEPFGAEDVEFTALAMWQQLGANPMLQRIAGARVAAPLRVEISFHDPAPEFAVLASLAGSGGLVLPRHLYAGTDLTRNPYNNKPVGTGPFRFKEWVRGSHVEFVRNSDYWDAPLPYLDKLIIRYIQDRGARAAAMEAGEVQVGVSTPLSRQDINRLAETPRFTVSQQGALAEFMNLEMNLSNPILADLKVRQAIAHAIDRDFVANVLMRGLGTAARGPIAPWQPFHNANVQQDYPVDLDRARALLDAAGYPQKRGGRFTLHVVATPWYEENAQMAALVRQQLRRIGVETEIETPDRSAAMRQIYMDRDFDIAISNNVSYVDPVLRTTLLYTSENIGRTFGNASGYANPEVDRIARAMLFETNAQKRSAMADDFQRIVSRDIPIIPIAWKGNVMIYDRTVHNVTARPEVQYDSWKDMWVGQ
jgi:peptide/nickel transport system substrate-binding protein